MDSALRHSREIHRVESRSIATCSAVFWPRNQTPNPAWQTPSLFRSGPAMAIAGAAISEAGFNPVSDQELTGIRVIRQEQMSPAFDANTYAYTAAEFQGNLFRIPLH